MRITRTVRRGTQEYDLTALGGGWTKAEAYSVMKLIRCDRCKREVDAQDREARTGWQVSNPFDAVQVPDLCPSCKQEEAKMLEVFDFANA